MSFCTIIPQQTIFPNLGPFIRFFLVVLVYCISLSPFLLLWVFLIHPLSFPLFSLIFSVSILLIGVEHLLYNNCFVSSSCNTLKVFSIFVCLLSYSSMPLFFYHLFSPAGFGLGAHSCILTFLVAPSPTSSSCYNFCFLALGVPVLFSTSALPWVSLSSFLGSFGFCFSSCTSLTAETYDFPPWYPSIYFTVSTSHLSCLILFWILASFLYCSHVFLSSVLWGILQ